MDEFDDEGNDLLSSVVLDYNTLQKEQCENLDKDNFVADVWDDDDLVDVDAGKEKLRKVVTEEETVQIPEKFPFPFEPYTIQKEFMSELYRCLEQKKVGIFESPTGTGKSLSLICGTLKWLKDYQEKQRAELEALMQGNYENKENTGSSNTACNLSHNVGSHNPAEPDWITDFKNKQEVVEKSKKMKEEVEYQLKRVSKLNELKKSKSLNKRKRFQLEDEFDDLIKMAPTDIKDAFKSEMEQQKMEDCELDSDDAHLIVDYNSDDGEKDKEESDEEKDEEVPHCTKIYFCSRTHSQLSQFVREIIKSPFGDDARVVSLGSRQNLCVNEAVRKLKSLTLINDTCRELQKNKGSTGKDRSQPKCTKKGTSKHCPFYKQDSIKGFRDATLLDVRDIEQLVNLGKHMNACPYYGTRLALPDAEIVALPYNTLLHLPTRQASGIQLRDNIVVIDEAHNLLETINNVYSTEITGAQLVRAHSQLSQYESKYRCRFKAQNLMYIKQILFVLGNLTKCIGGRIDKEADKQILAKVETKLWTVNDFLFHSQLDNVNMFKILQYCQKSLISRKLHGFVEKYKPEIITIDKEKKPETSTSGLSTFLKSLTGKGTTEEQVDVTRLRDDRDDYIVMSSPLMQIEGFLLALTNADKDGRIVMYKQKLFSQCSIKYLLLNPAIHFSSIVQEARAVIVAGGTMQPISEFRDQLFYAAGVKPERILQYSCGHIIPGKQLLPITVSTGPTGTQLDFTFQNRNNSKLLDELGRLVLNICNIVPGGVICFFPSYEYEKFVYEHWETSGVIAKLYTKKKVFREPRRAGQADQILQEYTLVIQNCSGTMTGAILLCVVGGKMSEGINFSDDLGRCVMMVGMPYPNINSPELKEKMDYLNANFPKDNKGKLPGQVHYENLCMKAVNQSIGRAIRHQNDYATILLLDKRYSRLSTVSKLPGWIAEHLKKIDNFGDVFAEVSKFFSGKVGR